MAAEPFATFNRGAEVKRIIEMTANTGAFAQRTSRKSGALKFAREDSKKFFVVRGTRVRPLAPD